MQFQKFDIFDTIRETWKIFKQYLGMVLLGWVLAMVANMAIAMGLWMIHTVVDILIAICLGAPAVAAFDGARHNAGGAAVGIGLMITKLTTQIIFQLIQTVLSMFVTAGLLAYFIKFARTGTPPDLKTLLVYDKRVLSMFLFQLLLGLIILSVISISFFPGGLALALAASKKASYVPAIVLGSLGLLVLLAAVIYIQLAMSQAFYLIVEKRVGPVDALTLSIKVMKGNKMNLFLLSLMLGAAGLVIILGTCFIGIIFFAPFSLLLMAKVYVNIVSEDFTPEVLVPGDFQYDFPEQKQEHPEDRQESFYR